MDLAINLNNIGVDRLMEDRDDEAHFLFKGSLEAILWVSQHCEEDAFLQNSDDLEMLKENRFVDKAIQLASKRSSTLRQTGSNTANVTQEHLYFHRGGLRINQAVTSQYQASVANNLVSPLVLYNLGVLEHRKYAKLPTNTSSLEKTMKFYNMALDLVYECECECENLLAALLNNMCIIFYEIGDRQQSREACDRIQEALQSLSNHSTSCAITLLDPQHIEEIFLNVMMFNEPINAACAA
mmetsp:Transcript_10680/g.12849  ORF Transcript_10680/g.12849 Transcript_10680/m.12849 type:complete len:240 (+) Transcript_10680:2-721(+)